MRLQGGLSDAGRGHSEPTQTRASTSSDITQTEREQPPGANDLRTVCPTHEIASLLRSQWRANDARAQRHAKAMPAMPAVESHSSRAASARSPIMIAVVTARMERTEHASPTSPTDSRQGPAGRAASGIASRIGRHSSWRNSSVFPAISYIRRSQALKPPRYRRREAIDSRVRNKSCRCVSMTPLVALLVLAATTGRHSMMSPGR